MNTLKTTKIRPNPNNPRIIRDEKFRQLVKSLRDFPEMLQARPIVVDPDNMVLGGNMRLKACVEAGIKEVPVYVATWDEIQQKQFIIKDNIGYGEWDWDMLANEWDATELAEWGLDVWQPEAEIDLSILEELDSQDPEEFTDGVRKAVCIDFTLEQHAEAAVIVQRVRNEGKDIGTLVLSYLKTL